jgi:hypothetical protein
LPFVKEKFSSLGLLWPFRYLRSGRRVGSSHLASKQILLEIQNTKKKEMTRQKNVFLGASGSFKTI